MIHLGWPHVINSDFDSKLEVPITIDGTKSELWISVENKYSDYLSSDRNDGFLVAILNYAIRNNHDIYSDAPITEELLFNIDKYLVDALCRYNSNFKRPQIHAETISANKSNINAVGTGISCGVDSLHTIANYTNSKYKNHNITHLVLNNVGSHGSPSTERELYIGRCNIAKKFTDEYDFELVIVNSNIQQIITQNHYKSHTYVNAFTILCLQKLFSTYFYASAGYNYHEFTLCDTLDSGSYELILLPYLSTRNLRFYSGGEGVTRLEKISTLIKYQPSFKYLNVCFFKTDNCNLCEKCIRTLLELDALNSLEKYSLVFNIEYYYKNIDFYLTHLQYYVYKKSKTYIEIYPYLKHKVTIKIKVKAFSKIIYEKLSSFKAYLLKSLNL